MDDFGVGHPFCVFFIGIDPVNQCKISSPENIVRFGCFVKNRDR
jgi:hypothetical protein